MEDIGARIKKIRQEKRITQKQLASEMGISQTAIALWENGSRQLSLSALDEIAHYLDVSANYLMYGEPDIDDPISDQGITVELKDGSKHFLSTSKLQEIIEEKQDKTSYEDVEQLIARNGKEFSTEEKMKLIKLLSEID